MKCNSAKNVARTMNYICTGLVLLAGGVQAQSEPGSSPATPAPATPAGPVVEHSFLPARQGSSYQPGAGYQLPAAGGPKDSADKIERARKQENNLRRMMASFGVTELDIQNAIIVYVQEEVQRRQPLREQGRRLYKALRDETISAAEMAGLLTDFRAVVEADKARRTAAETALNDQTGYTTNPRLEAMLLLFGVIGDGPTIMTVPVPNSAPAPNASIASTTPGTSEKRSASKAIPSGIDNDAVQPVQDDALQPALGFSETQRLALLDQFDFNHDGELDAAERNEAREVLAREFLASGLWPPANKKKEAPGGTGGSGSTTISSGNASAGSSTGDGSIPVPPPVPRIPGPLPVIPAQAVTPANPQSDN